MSVWEAIASDLKLLDCFADCVLFVLFVQEMIAR
jgi:hypothetical protein